MQFWSKASCLIFKSYTNMYLSRHYFNIGSIRFCMKICSLYEARTLIFLTGYRHQLSRSLWKGSFLTSWFMWILFYVLKMLVLKRTSHCLSVHIGGKYERNCFTDVREINQLKSVAEGRWVIHPTKEARNEATARDACRGFLN